MTATRHWRRWARVTVVAVTTWIGCAGFVSAIGFADWIAATTAAILSVAMFVAGLIVARAAG